MLRALSTAATGMEAQQTRLDVTANNIANVATAGFKKSRVEFADLMYQHEVAPGAPTSEQSRSPTGTTVGLGVRTAGVERSHGQGSLRQTDNPLDMAIEGAGFFPVSMPNGETAFTRAGSFKLNNEGQVVTPEGHGLQADITVPPDALSITIAADGLVTAQVPNQVAPVELGRIELATFVNPAGLDARGHNLMAESASSGPPILGAPGENGTGALSQGMLELSNVQVVEEMIDLISGQRAYEVNARVIRAADEMLQQAANLR